MDNPIMRFFVTEHLPDHLQEPAVKCAQLAMEMEHILPNCAEKSAGLRKLLEAKDCFVRAAIPEPLPSPVNFGPEHIPR